MRYLPPFRRLVAPAVTLGLVLAVAAPPLQSRALSVERTDDGTAPVGAVVDDIDDEDALDWVPDGGSSVWEADLTVGSIAGRLGYRSSLGGDLTDASFTWNEADHSVQGATFTPATSGAGIGAVSFTVAPELSDETNALRLRLGALGLNLADATIDAGTYTWDDVEIDWERGDTIAISLEEFPQSFTPRAFDGRRNNAANPTWGSAGIALLKKAADAYADGVSTPTTGRPNARTISNVVFAQDESVTHIVGGSDLVWQWGQFIDHDITLSPDNLGEVFSIAVPSGDSVFDPMGAGEMTIELHRSAADASTGTGTGNPRRQINALTAFVDGSQVYGSDRARAGALRTNDGTGKLNTSGGGKFLPYNTQGLDNEGGAHRTNLFVAGDLRVNEQIGLIAMHTLFVREHNRLADLIAAENPDLSGDEIYELARKIVGAVIQNITYSEFLPLLLGPDALGTYAGYDADVDATIASEFSAASYRVGHTLLSSNLHLLDGGGESAHVELREAFFRPAFYDDHDIAEVLRGFASQQAQNVDALVIDDVRNFLMRGPGGPVFDLAALNIQRGRDHGLSDFNTVREAYGLDPVTGFADISSDANVQQALADAYGDVDDLDLWPAALAEDHAEGASVGETLQAVIGDQFRRLRDGDRFWFENDPFFVANTGLLDEVRGTTLADVIRRNTSVGSEMSDNVFVVPDGSATANGAASAIGAALDSAGSLGELVARQPAPATVTYTPPLVFY
ncbi:peroxidase family protein [Candidatus Poriferisodalis sp.]|uniref:peroxidase family protein n=1 Tax=Candidatus Poriferisodalis sp. TaxID=3101277 RepID=UPI003B016D32